MDILTKTLLHALVWKRRGGFEIIFLGHIGDHLYNGSLDLPDAGADHLFKSGFQSKSVSFPHASAHYRGAQPYTHSAAAAANLDADTAGQFDTLRYEHPTTHRDTGGADTGWMNPTACILSNLIR